MEVARATEFSRQLVAQETTILDSIHLPRNLQSLGSLPADGFGHELEAPKQTSSFPPHEFEWDIEWYGEHACWE